MIMGLKFGVYTAFLTLEFDSVPLLNLFDAFFCKLYKMNGLNVAQKPFCLNNLAPATSTFQ